MTTNLKSNYARSHRLETSHGSPSSSGNSGRFLFQGVDMKRCFKCGSEKNIEEFYRHPMMADGHLGKCKECTKKDTIENYDKNIDKIKVYEKTRFQKPQRKSNALHYQTTNRERHPEKYRARNLLNNAIRDGKITKTPCEVCGSEKSQSHHEDYSKPLEVRWLCFKHHRILHGQRNL